MSVYACADLHGMGKLWDNIKEFLKPEDKLYFLGDAIDRGPDGWRIFNEMLNDPRVTYILGNHEYMMEEFMEQVAKNGYENAVYSEEGALWLTFNHGDTTNDGWFYSDVEPDEVVRIIKNMPLSCTYINKEGVSIILCHAGYTPPHIPTSINDFVWNRRHIVTGPWDGYDDYPPFLMVHGHTPCDVLIDMLEEENIPEESGNPHEYIVYPSGIVWYWNAMKICIDVGSFWSHEAVLLDLDTYEQILITEDGIKKEGE